MKEKILEFAEGYGVALQIIDDLRKMKEDKKSGYSSLPLSEGPPFTQTFEQFYLHIIKARESLQPEWKRMQKLVDNLEKFGKSLEEELNRGEKKIIILVSGLVQNNELLLLRRSYKNTSNKGRWQLPEDKMEAGETPKQALVREIKEETGLKARNLKLLMQTVHPMKVRGNRFVRLRKINDRQKGW